jgi:O-antigen/teichoic acid export membrane protein
MPSPELAGQLLKTDVPDMSTGVVTTASIRDRRARRQCTGVIEMLEHRRSIALVARNSKWNLIAFAVGVLSNLVLLPYIVGTIGIRQFGISGLLFSVSTPLSLIGSILGQTACQAIASSRARKDYQATQDACATVTALAAYSVSAGALVLVVLVSLIFRSVMAGDSPSTGSLPVVTVALVIWWIELQASVIMQGVHVACMDYRRIAAISAVSAAANVACIVVAVSAFPSVSGYLCGLCAAQAITCVAWLISVLSSYRWFLVRPRFVKELRDSVFAFSSWLTISQLVTSLSAQTDKYVLGAWNNANAVGYFNIALRVEEAAYSLMVKASDSLFPYFSSIANGDHRPHARFYISVSWLINLAAAAVIAPLIPLAPSIISTWVSANTAVYAGGVLRLLAIAGLLGCASHVFKQYMLGTTMTRQLAILNIVTGSITALISFTLVPFYGLRAAGFGFVAAAVVQLLITIHLVRRHFPESAKLTTILHTTIIPCGSALLIAGVMTLHGIPEIHTWPMLIGVYVSTSAGIVFAVLMANAASPEGRDLLKDLHDLMLLARGLHSAQIES